MNKLFLLLLVLVSTKNIYAQVDIESYTIKGNVFADNDLIMFTSIGIVNKNIGTLTDDSGNFSLEIPSQFINDTLTVSHVGYHTKKIEIKHLINVEFLRIKLEPNVFELDEVLIVAKRKGKTKFKEFGNKKKSDLFLWLREGDKGSEIVTLIKPKSEITLNTVSLNILNTEGEAFSLLLNVYDLDPTTKLPNKQLLKKQKLIKSNQTKGWLKVDLKDEVIILNEPFYIGFQWTDVDKSIPLVGAKIKKSKRDFVRYKALGSWEKYAEWDIKITAELSK